MTRGRGASRARSAGALAALVFLVALNLRPSITAVGPLLPQIGADLGIDKPAQGLLGALPLIAFGVVSPLVHHASRRLGPDRTMFLALLVLAAGTVIRSYTGIAGLWIGTAILGSAIAVSNVLMPLLVKRDYSTRISLATGLYSTCLNVAAGVASSVAVPLSVVAGWQGGLAFWAIPALLVAVLWITRLRVRPATAPAAPSDTSVPDASVPETPVPNASAGSRAPSPRPISVWRQPTAWLLTTFMAMQSTAFYVIVTWLPTIEASSGIAPERSGIHLLLFQAVGALAGLAIPHLMRRTESQVPATLTASIPLFIGILGLLFLPGLGAVWAVIAGLGISASFVVALSLVSMRGRNPHETTSLSGMVQSLGYLAAAVGPVVAGYLAQLTGGWTASMAMLAVIAGLQIVVALFVGRPSATLR